MPLFLKLSAFSGNTCASARTSPGHSTITPLIMLTDPSGNFKFVLSGNPKLASLSFQVIPAIVITDQYGAVQALPVEPTYPPPPLSTQQQRYATNMWGLEKAATFQQKRKQREFRGSALKYEIKAPEKEKAWWRF